MKPGLEGPRESRQELSRGPALPQRPVNSKSVSLSRWLVRSGGRTQRDPVEPREKAENRLILVFLRCDRVGGAASPLPLPATRAPPPAATSCSGAGNTRGIAASAARATLQAVGALTLAGLPTQLRTRLYPGR